jgi:putative glycosyltransferase (TIGR04372 family)
MIVLRPVLRVIACLISLLILPVLYLIEPFYKIRITPLHTARIGHMAMNTQRYVCAQIFDGPERKTFRIIFGANPCNRQLMNMWLQQVHIVDSILLTAFYHYAYPILGNTVFFDALEGEMFHYREMDQPEPLLSFSDDEESKGKHLLEEMGIGDVPWFVCFFARDGGYHGNRGFQDVKHHRNTDIETYLRAAENIVENGGAAVRLGAGVERALPDGLHPHIVDYAFNHQSDFGDIYLIAKCRYFLASAGGIIHVAPIFKTPVAAVNMFPHLPAPTGRHSLFIPKLLSHLENGEVASFSAAYRAKAFAWEPVHRVEWDNFETFEKNRFGIIENTPQEIHELCLDMEDSLAGKEPDQEAAEIQQIYKQRFLSGGPYDLDHVPNIGPRFAKKYKQLIVAD